MSIVAVGPALWLRQVNIMSDETIKIRIEGLNEAIRGIQNIDIDLPRYLRGAGQEVSRDLLGVRGLQNYPPATAANQPPPPFYVRGRGMQTSASRNDGKSERLGTRWETRQHGQYGTEIRNPASYAEWVHGLKQARAMAAIGWRILLEVAKERVDIMTGIYGKWVDNLLRKNGLK